MRFQPFHDLALEILRPERPVAGVDPHAWLSDTLTAIVKGHKQSKIDDLLPWVTKAGLERHA